MSDHGYPYRHHQQQHHCFPPSPCSGRSGRGLPTALCPASTPVIPHPKHQTSQGSALPKSSSGLVPLSLRTSSWLLPQLLCLLPPSPSPSPGHPAGRNIHPWMSLIHGVAPLGLPATPPHILPALCACLSEQLPGGSNWGCSAPCSGCRDSTHT